MSQNNSVRTADQQQAIANAAYASTKATPACQAFAKDVEDRVKRESSESGQASTMTAFVLGAIALIAASMVSAAGVGGGLGSFLTTSLFGG